MKMLGKLLFTLLFPWWLFKAIIFWKKNTAFMFVQYGMLYENMFVGKEGFKDWVDITFSLK